MNEVELLSPSQRDSKLSSLIESPMPPVTDPKTIQSEMGGIKDFSR